MKHLRLNVAVYPELQKKETGLPSKIQFFHLGTFANSERAKFMNN